MSTQKHPNSKRITIFRAGSFITDAQTQAQEFMALSKKSIGPYWQSVNGKGTGSGLSFAEIDILLPYVLDLPKEDRSFREKVKEFYQGIITRVPTPGGVELEIGLTLDNSKPVTYKDPETGLFNVPIEMMDYLRYRHALGHPKVAHSKDAALGNMLKEYYIFDKEDAINKSVDLSNAKDEALTLYFRVKDDTDKAYALMVLLGIDPRNFTGKNAHSLRMEALRAKADTDPVTFVNTFKQDNFEIKYTLQAMVNYGILRKIASQYVITETQEIIGNNFEEAIFFFKDKTASSTIAVLKGQLQEAVKALNVPPKKAKTQPIQEESPE